MLTLVFFYLILLIGRFTRVGFGYTCGNLAKYVVILQVCSLSIVLKICLTMTKSQNQSGHPVLSRRTLSLNYLLCCNGLNIILIYNDIKSFHRTKWAHQDMTMPKRKQVLLKINEEIVVLILSGFCEIKQYEP